jgi:predicted ATPase
MAAIKGPIRFRRREIPTLTKIAITGYKSISTRQEIEIRPLTVLAGTNSSGKSSIMQPVLLLKQTIEETYDPGALLLHGPNVRYTAAEQVLSRNAEGEEGSKFSIELASHQTSVRVRYVKRKKQPFDIDLTEFTEGDDKLVLTPGDASEPLHDRVVEALQLARVPHHGSRTKRDQEELSVDVRRNRCFLEVYVSDPLRVTPFGLNRFSALSRFSPILRGLIHLSGLRGNPERTYPVTAVGDNFPGTFEKYVASIIARWQSSGQSTKLRAVSSDLQFLGLTWKVTARAINETQVELQVGRLSRSAVGGARDLVSIADVGVGVSQTLPVIVALHVARPGQIVYIEQPEIHLHPRAQTELATVLARAAKRGVRVIIETHSDLLLLGIQEAVAAGHIGPDLVKLHWFDRKDGVTQVASANLDSAGAFGEWPEDFGEVRMKAEDRYFSAAEEQLGKASD